MYNAVVVLGSSILLAYIEQTKVRVCGYGRCLSARYIIYIYYNYNPVEVRLQLPVLYLKKRRWDTKQASIHSS